MNSSNSIDLWIDKLIRFLKVLKLILVDPLIEVARGIWTNSTPVAACSLFGGVLGLLYRFEYDKWLFLKTKLPIFIFEGKLRIALGILITCSGFFLWGAFMVAKRNEIKRKMKLIFKNAGIKSKIDLSPEFISDHPIGRATRKLTLFNNGISVSELRAAKDGLEVGLGVQISRMDYADERKRTVEIVYVTEMLPEFYILESINQYKEFSFPIGKGLSTEYTASLLKFPHYLVAGETGTGKSTFVRMAVEILLANNELLEVVFLDFKGGIEGESFQNNPRVKVISDFNLAEKEISELDTVLTTRNAALAEAKAKNIDDFNRKRSDWSKKLKRTLVVVDEASEIVPKLSGNNHKELTTINRVLNRIARMGRASGLHLMIGVQKPDQKNLDPTIKANLGGVICFAVSHPIQSMVVLGDGRAADLNSAIRGRAIWKYGAFSEEVQTPLLNAEQVEKANERAQAYWGAQRKLPGAQSKIVSESRSNDVNETHGSDSQEKEIQSDEIKIENSEALEPPRAEVA